MGEGESRRRRRIEGEDLADMLTCKYNTQPPAIGRKW